METRPTPRQREYLIRMVRHFDATGGWPAVRELAAAAGTVASVAFGQLRALERKGLAVRIKGGKHNSWRPARWAFHFRPAAALLLREMETLPCRQTSKNPPARRPLTSA